MSMINSQPLIGASGNQGVAGYNLTKSLRFRSAASAYLSRTPASAGNRQTWTWSGWVKLGTLGVSRQLFVSRPTSSPYALFYIFSDNTINFADNVLNSHTTSAVFRDPSAWYHIVLTIDTTQATSSNRVRLYVNGVLQTWATTTAPTQNASGQINTATAHSIGSLQPFSATEYFDGYMAEQNFVDGQALTPSSFGETDTITGVWKPKRYTGTYGTNGFYLPFTDVATTSGSNAGLGKDFSGNGNYWNTNNISVTTGATYDSMTDVPTLTSATAANYAVMNPLDLSGSGITVSNGNLNVTCSAGSTYYFAKASMAIPTTGGYYWETTISTIGQFPIVGIQPTSRSNVNSGSVYLGNYSDEISWFGGLNEIYQNGVNILSVSSASNGDVIMVAHKEGKTWIGKNGTWFNSGNPTAGTGNLGSTLSGQLSAALCLRGSTAPVVDANFGQRGFNYTPPTGYLALNTYNLPDSTIVAGNKNMDVVTWSGTGTALGNTLSVTTTPNADFMWVKQRDTTNTASHVLSDVVRGNLKVLRSNGTDEENSSNIDPLLYDGIQNLGTTSPQMYRGASGLYNGTNGNGKSYVGWTWKANGAGSSNTSGTITSTVSANAAAGFSIVTYTSPSGGATAYTVGHGLGVAPSLVISKERNVSGIWSVYHKSTGDGRLQLQSTAAVTTGVWTTLPTSTTFWQGVSYADGSQRVAYCWSEIAGFSKFGSYIGNGSTDGTFVYTGFKPKFILIKNSSAVSNWVMWDTTRSTFNEIKLQLFPNTGDSEDNTGACDALSNGFKLRNTNGTWNGSGSTYIYMAFAENPFKNSLAR